VNTIKKNRISIIEDQPGFRRIYHDVLEREGFEVLEAEDGESGWELVKTQKPDLVILDLVLPKIHGYEVLKKIRADETTEDIPVIIFSVLGEQEDIQRGLELGANDHMIKGFNSSRELLSKIRALLTKTDIKNHIVSYRLLIKKEKDAADLERDFGLRLFQCPYCNTPMLLELTPDYTRSDGHWFFAHFVCPKCNRPL
jgi:DNA-binding response OmpR family regulator